MLTCFDMWERGAIQLHRWDTIWVEIIIELQSTFLTESIRTSIQCGQQRQRLPSRGPTTVTLAALVLTVRYSPFVYSGGFDADCQGWEITRINSIVVAYTVLNWLAVRDPTDGDSLLSEGVRTSIKGGFQSSSFNDLYRSPATQKCRKATTNQIVCIGRCSCTGLSALLGTRFPGTQ